LPRPSALADLGRAAAGGAGGSMGSGQRCRTLCLPKSASVQVRGVMSGKSWRRAGKSRGTAGRTEPSANKIVAAPQSVNTISRNIGCGAVRAYIGSGNEPARHEDHLSGDTGPRPAPDARRPPGRAVCRAARVRGHLLV
jgi:hypothetical protein